MGTRYKLTGGIVALALIASPAAAASRPAVVASVSPLVVLGALGSDASRAALCGAAASAVVAGAAAAVQTTPPSGCVLPVVDAPPVVAAPEAVPAYPPVASTGFGLGIGALLAGLVSAVGLAVLLASGGGGKNRSPISAA